MRSVPGLTSRKTQNFINSICKHAESYLEVGSAFGATASAALNNNRLNAYFVDKWEGTIQDAKGLQNFPELDKQLFIDTIRTYKGENNIKLFQCDMFDVDLSEIEPIDVFFYDADHDKEITRKAIEYFSPVFSDTCILLIDDANFDGVVEGAREAINNLNLIVSYERLILNDLEDPEAWWNGIYIIVVKKHVPIQSITG
jgi:predicted O-methyltransferase YrrM